MARLIDADKRIAEIKKIYCDGCDNRCGAKCLDCWVDDAMCLIDDAPTVDAVEVVRCRECKNHSDAYGKHYCKFWRMYCPDDSEFFCKAGKRKDGDGNG